MWRRGTLREKGKREAIRKDKAKERMTLRKETKANERDYKEMEEKL